MEFSAHECAKLMRARSIVAQPIGGKTDDSQNTPLNYLFSLSKSPTFGKLLRVSTCLIHRRTSTRHYER